MTTDHLGRELEEEDGMTRDYLGRDLEDDGDKPQTVEDFARERGNLTGPYGEAEERQEEDQPVTEDDGEQRDAPN